MDFVVVSHEYQVSIDSNSINNAVKISFNKSSSFYLLSKFENLVKSCYFLDASNQINLYQMVNEMYPLITGRGTWYHCMYDNFFQIRFSICVFWLRLSLNLISRWRGGSSWRVILLLLNVYNNQAKLQNK